MDIRTAHAFIRFGLGRRAGEPVPADPVAWLIGQLDGDDPVLAHAAPSLQDTMDALRLDREEGKETRMPVIRRAGGLYLAEMAAMAQNLLTTTVPFRERLVWFWANHFTVSTRIGGEILAPLTSFVRTAVRPYVTGRFGDMLTAVMHHPAMLMYLDNIVSFGPNSEIGRRLHLGTNENLARESLELHTLTPASGYTQRDVSEYAKILSGWTFDPGQTVRGFVFDNRAHEPGPKTVMGRTVGPGQAGGEEIIAFLAGHPSTLHALAVAMVRHFVADDPPDRAVRHVETVLRDTRGDLKAASLALLELPEAWQPLTKLRGGRDYAFAVLRGLGAETVPAPERDSALSQFGESFFGAPFPNGYPDTAPDWDSGEDLLRRVDWVHRMMVYHTAKDPEVLARDCLGELLSTETLNAIRQTKSRRDALTLALTAPEFQRR